MKLCVVIAVLLDKRRKTGKEEREYKLKCFIKVGKRKKRKRKTCDRFYFNVFFDLSFLLNHEEFVALELLPVE